MQFSEARQGRTFILRLEDGEIVHEVLEKFAEDQGIKAAAILILGGASKGSRLVTGPEKPEDRPIAPMTSLLEDVHEIAGTGTLFPDENKSPVVHMHMACGRKEKTVTGCIRQGVRVWQVMEVILFELLESRAKRELDKELGFMLLRP